MRTFVSATVALALCAGSALAEDYKGKVTKVEKDSITIKVDGKEMTFNVSDKTTFSSPNKQLNEKLEADKLNCKVFTRTGKGAPTVTITSADGKTATAIKVGGGKKKPKKDA